MHSLTSFVCKPSDTFFCTCMCTCVCIIYSNGRKLYILHYDFIYSWFIMIYLFMTWRELCIDQFYCFKQLHSIPLCGPPAVNWTVPLQMDTDSFQDFQWIWQSKPFWQSTLCSWVSMWPGLITSIARLPSERMFHGFWPTHPQQRCILYLIGKTDISLCFLSISQIISEASHIFLLSICVLNISIFSGNMFDPLSYGSQTGVYVSLDHLTVLLLLILFLFLGQ